MVSSPDNIRIDALDVWEDELDPRKNTIIWAGLKYQYDSGSMKNGVTPGYTSGAMTVGLTVQYGAGEHVYIVSNPMLSIWQGLSAQFMAVAEPTKLSKSLSRALVVG